MEKNVTVLFDNTNDTTRETLVRERLFKRLAEMNGYESADDVNARFIEEEIEYENKVMLENLNDQLKKILSESSIIVQTLTSFTATYQAECRQTMTTKPI